MGIHAERCAANQHDRLSAGVDKRPVSDAGRSYGRDTSDVSISISIENRVIQSCFRIPGVNRCLRSSCAAFAATQTRPTCQK